MSFRFNFPCANDSDTSDISIVNSLENKCTEDESAIPCGFLEVTNLQFQVKDSQVVKIKFGHFEVKYILIKNIQEVLKDQTLLMLEDLKTDLLPGKYEGGFKIWECSLDLAQFLAEEKCISEGDSVLELGCGAGLPGIVGFLSGAFVTFQDFNREVLERMTLSNVLLNTPYEKIPQIPKICKFLYGDWSTIKSYFADSLATRHDIIITSETVYEKSNHLKLLNLMKSSLKPDGVIYLATKAHYFGVGGSIVDFQMLVDQDKTFEIEAVKKIVDGMERQILKMNFRTKGGV